MFNDNYEIEPKGIPLVAYFKELKVECPPKIFTEMHYHSDFEILYITEGRAKMTVNTDTFYAGEGSMILINPYEVHYGEVLTNNFSYYCIDFNLNLLSFDNRDSVLSGDMKFRNCVTGNIFAEYVKDIYLCYFEENTGWAMRAIGTLYILFSFLENELISITSVKDNNFAKKVINYINENFSRNISSKTAAEDLSYNQSYFCRMFRKNFSLKFSDYLNIYRIKTSKELLRKHSVSQTAIYCGFSSISYFSLEFKRRCGVSPTEFKKKYSVEKNTENFSING